MGFDEDLAGFRKAARAVAAAGKALDKASKALGAGERDPAAVADVSEKAAAALGGLQGIEAAAAGLSGRLSAIAAEARAELERERALLAGKVASALREQGIEVEGNLPQLRAGALTLEFAFGGKGGCTVWLGPKKARLAACPLEAGAIAAKVSELDSALLGGPFDEAAFLAALLGAFRVALARAGLPDGSRVPLVALLAEVAFARQSAAFLADPRREAFHGYGRVEFACDLSRLAARRVGDREFRLDVATMSQTRRPEDHLWVPRGRSGDGTNYATALFAKVA
ncbi:MAG: hypothetical protein FJ087_12305 [Deltaproteobacteria bacterium]|nr:hypothetical protein [Deltaproteobacteria bacterium]